VSPIDPKTGEVVKNVEGSVQTNAALLPRVDLAPPSGIAAYYGQTLVLNAHLAPIPGATVPSNIAWVVGGRVVCTKEVCELPLDGETLGQGTASLMLVAYNAYGSTYTRHVIQVLKSNWNPSKTMSKSVRKEEPGVAIDVPVEKIGADRTRIYMVRGNAVHAYPDYLNMVGTVPRPFEFRGRLKTQDVAVARLQDPGTGDWFVLGYSDVAFAREDKKIVLTMQKGGARMHSIATNIAKKDRRFAENIEINAIELKATPSEGGDIYVTRLAPTRKSLEKREKRKKGEPLPLEEQYSARVVVIAGQARVTLTRVVAGRPGQFTLPAGVEFLVYEDGTVAPLARPNPKRMEKLMRMTITPEEVAAQAQAKAKASSVDLPKVLDEAAKLTETEDWFEILQLVGPVEPRAKEDARIYYFLGLANRGVYQVSEAEKYFKLAVAQKPSYADAHWQLAQMNMEGKKWPDASENLDAAESSFEGDDKRRAEVPYYRGVVEFNQGNTFSARSSFTKSLWEQTLDGALKQSSGSFLQTLGKQKNWTLVVPVGVQYEHNALGLGSTEALPADYPKKSLVRALGGAIFNWDTAPNAESSGLYLGAGAKALVLYNTPRKGFSGLDAWVAEVSVSETLVEVKKGADDKAPPEISNIRMYQSLSSVILNKELSTQTLTAGVVVARADLSLGYENDAQNKGAASRSAVLGKQGYGLGLYASEGGGLSVDADFLLEERFVAKSTDTNGHQVSLTVTPALSMPFSARASTRVGLLIGMQHTRTKPAETVLKMGPNAAFNYFLTPWLMSVASVGYEFNMQKPTTRNVSKPSASFILTGLF